MSVRRPFRLRRPVLAATLVAVAAIGAAAPAAAASPAIAIRPIGPHQAFVGRTEGPLGVDTVAVACPGATRFGHPLPGQTVEVLPAASVLPGGFTGARAHAIVVSFPSPVTDPPPPTATPTPVLIVLRAYEVPAPIPTSLVLPCAATGVVRFTPVPTSRQARADLVPVRFVPGPVVDPPTAG